MTARRRRPRALTHLLAEILRSPRGVWLCHPVIKALRVLAGACISAPFHLFNTLCCALDDLLFPGYRDIEVRSPVFVVGLPRSGTTLMHHLLASDEERFTAVRLWEVLFAPSILQRKVLGVLGAIDAALGAPLRRAVTAVDRLIWRAFQGLHPSSLFHVEEDEAFFLYGYRCYLNVMAAAPSSPYVRALCRFDEDLPAEEREKMLGFYKARIQRHLYVHGPGKRYLSKSPFSTPKIRSLAAAFPDARFCCMIRNPYEGVPSALSLITKLWRDLQLVNPTHPGHLELLLGNIDHFYGHALATIDAWPDERASFVVYEELARAPVDTVVALLLRFGLEPGDTGRQAIEEAARARASYKSMHRYDVSEFGLTDGQLRRRFDAVFRRFPAFQRAAETAPTDGDSSRSPRP